jgi:hypothetical protein
LNGPKSPPFSKRGPPSKAPLREEDFAVTKDDLKNLEKIHAILKLLNEPRQSAAPLAGVIEKIPVLARRLRRAYRPPQWYTQDAYGEPNLTTVLAMLGNAPFEAVLLEYLEDLTVLKATLEE